MSSHSSDLNRDSPSDQDGPSAPKRARRNVKHVSRACDSCKSKKTKCDGVHPTCGPCSTKSWTCTYTKADGRKSKGGSSGQLRDRIGSLIDLLSSKTDLLVSRTQSPTAARPQSPSVSQSPSQPQPPPPQPPAVEDDDAGAYDYLEPGFDDGHITSTSLPNESLTLANLTSSLDASAPPAPMVDSSPNNASDSHSPLIPASLGSQGHHVTPLGDRLKRSDAGTLMQFGPTSLWSYIGESSGVQFPPTQSAPDLRPGDWIDWARPLPSELNISKSVHDAALACFAAYYAPWFMIVDIPAFLRDLEVCNLVTRIPRPTPSPSRTPAYSPLLHNCALYMGLHIGRGEWWETIESFDAAMDKHCAGLIMNETEDPGMSTPQALALYASCLNVRKDKSARNTGYIYFGMAFAAVQALGVNLNCDDLVDSGQMTGEERDLRNACFWTIFQQDVLRAIAAGRPPMLGQNIDVAFPRIDPAVDEISWYSANRQKMSSVSGRKSMRSTVFHWSTRLHCLLRKVIETTLFSPNGDVANRDARVITIAAELETWHREQPFPHPSRYPLPHLLVMHMMYHLTQIYLFRPFYRAELDINPPPAQRCDQAAAMCADLLKVYAAEHGLRNGPATLIPIVFASATVHLLALLSQSGPTESQPQLDSFNESVQFMGELAQTWIEARRGLQVLNTLQAEWPPYRETTTATNEQNNASAELDFSAELPRELHEWLLGTTYYDILHASNVLGPNITL